MTYKQIIRSISFVVALSAMAITAQTRYLRGKVSNGEGVAVDGASVKVAGTEIMTLTNSEGIYSLAVPSGAKKLEVKAVNFKPLEIDIPAGSDIVDINLTPDPLGSNALNVTAMAIQKERESIGYSTTQISGGEVTLGKDRSVFNGLQGKVAGLYITNSGGTPGSSTRIQLRGPVSFGDNQPLIVVDGIPIDNSSFQNSDALNHQADNGNRANDLNPYDVETVDILKGPSAAALYGSRASGGAIIITTKSGKSGLGINNKLTVTYNTGYSLENFIKHPEYQNVFGQGYDSIYNSKENRSWGTKFNDSSRVWGQSFNGSQKIKNYSAIQDNIKNFFRNGHTFTNNIALSGGTEKTGYYFSFSDLRNTNPVPGTNYKRNSVKGSAYVQLPNNFYSGFSVNYIRSSSEVATQGAGYSFFNQLLQTPRDIPVNELKDLSDPFNSLQYYYGAYTLNPYYVLESSSNRNTTDNTIGMASIGYKYKNWLDIMYRVGSNFYTDSRYQHEPKIEGITGQNALTANNPGFYYESVNRLNEITGDLIINVKRQLHKDVKMNVVAGQNTWKRTQRFFAAKTNGLVIPGFYNLANSQGRPEVENTLLEKTIYGVYVDAGLSFKNYLFLNLTARNDWSSVLPVSQRSYFYPGINTAWIFSNTFDMPEVIKFGKIRLASAITGKDPDAYLLTSSNSTSTIGNGFNNSQLLSPYSTKAGYEGTDRIANHNLRPEFTISREAGIEMSFFDQDRLGVDFTYYSNLSKDIIFRVPLVIPSSSTYMGFNAASFTNNGVELLLRGTPVMNKNFRWNLSLIFAKNNNKVTELYQGVDQVIIDGLNGAAIVAAVGKPFGAFYTYGEQKTDDGKTIVDSATGLPLRTSSPQYYGSYNPDFNLTLRNTFTYKNWSLNIQVDHRNGGVVYSQTKDLLEYTGASSNTLNINGSGDERQNEIVANSVYKNYKGEYVENTRAAGVQAYWSDRTILSRNLLDATFTKLREVSIGYELPKYLLKKTPFGSASVGFAGRNLLIWTPKENKFIDPETNSLGTGNAQGMEFLTLPGLRTYTFYLKVSF